MKLLLDAMYSPGVAARLRVRGHDAVAIAERPELVAMSDSGLLEAMAAESRTIVTNNVLDYVPLFRHALLDGGEPPALLLTEDRTMPRTSAEIGRFVSMLEGLAAGEPPTLPGVSNDARQTP